MIKITKLEANTERSEAFRKKRTAAYCRVSTDSREQLASLDAQRQHFESLIKKNPAWEYVGIYYDEGVSGTSVEKRDGLNSLLGDCEKGKIDLIVTKSISRFARNAEECLEMIRKLQRQKVYIFFERENINTGEMQSELLISILSSFAEDESRSISKNTKWSIKNRFKDGTFVIGTPAYGYKNEDKRMVVDEEQAEVVRYIFEATTRGVGGYVIAKELNKRGVKPPRGKAWNSGSVTGIIRNEKYTGDALFQKVYTDDSFNRHINKGEKDQYFCEDHHEAIVDRKTYELANQMLELNKKRLNIVSESDKYQSRYPFSGKIICGECGAHFKRSTQTPSCSTGYVAWVCQTHVSDKERCQVKAIRNESFENAFVTMMNKLIVGRDVVLKPLYAAVKEQTQTGNLGRINEIEDLLAQNHQAKSRLVMLESKGYLNPELFQREFSDLSNRDQELNDEKRALSDSISSAYTSVNELSELLKFVTNNEPMDAFDADVFERFVENITVIDRTKIVFNLRCGLRLKEGV